MVVWFPFCELKKNSTRLEHLLPLVSSRSKDSMASNSRFDEDWVDISEPFNASSHEASGHDAPASIDGNFKNQSIPLRMKTTHATETSASYKSMRENADRLLKSGAPIFQVDLSDNKHAIRDAYNTQLGLHNRPGLLQEFNCSACHKFMKAFGNLALVDPENGTLKPLFWDKTFTGSFGCESVIADLFEGKRVRRLFRVTKSKMIAGTAESGGHQHMSFEFSTKRLRNSEPKGFANASCVELSQMLDKILTKYKESTVITAAELLVENKLPGAENHKLAIQWLQSLIKKQPLINVPGDVERHNMLCLIAADSFVGCIHQLRSGALSTLLDDIEEGLPYATFKGKWSATVDPLAYMRPSAAPSAGNIAAAERLFAELGITEHDLARRFLLMKDVPQEAFMYHDFNKPLAAKPIGVFSSLVPKSSSLPSAPDDPSIPPSSLTFASFVNTVVPSAKTIEYELSSYPTLHFSITGLPGTKPLMQWHSSTNLVSHYTYHWPLAATKHNLKAGWVTVAAIIPAAELWEGMPATRTLPLSDELVGEGESGSKRYKHGHRGWSYLLCLEGARDGCEESCLFPQSMKKEFHGVRSTIEAYSRSHGIPKPADDEPMVGGIMVKKSSSDMNHLFRVKNSDGKVRRYKVTLFQ